MEMNLIEIWGGMSSLVRTVVIVLTLQALGCIYVVIDRLILLVTAYRQGRKFARQAGPLLARGDYSGALEVARKHPNSHLAGYIITGVETFMEQRRRGADETKAAYLADRALERDAEMLGASLNRGMNILASTGSTAPSSSSPRSCRTWGRARSSTSPRSACSGRRPSRARRGST